MRTPRQDKSKYQNNQSHAVQCVQRSKPKEIVCYDSVGQRYDLLAASGGGVEVRLECRERFFMEVPCMDIGAVGERLRQVTEGRHSMKTR